MKTTCLSRFRENLIIVTICLDISRFTLFKKWWNIKRMELRYFLKVRRLPAMVLLSRKYLVSKRNGGRHAWWIDSSTPALTNRWCVWIVLKHKTACVLHHVCVSTALCNYHYSLTNHSMSSIFWSKQDHAFSALKISSLKVWNTLKRCGMFSVPFLDLQNIAYLILSHLFRCNAYINTYMFWNRLPLLFIVLFTLWVLKLRMSMNMLFVPSNAHINNLTSLVLRHLYHSPVFPFWTPKPTLEACMLFVSAFTHSLL
jgi:hypothetical protein